MKRFQFRLERVLQLKQQLESRKQQEVAAVAARLHRAEQILERLALNRSRCHQHRNRMVEKGSSQLDITLMDQHQQHLSRQIKQQNRVITSIEAEMAKKQAELREAVREKEKYEQYHSRKWDEYQQEILKEEQQFLDEVAIRKHHFHPQSNAN